jgi:hypothetical protein
MVCVLRLEERIYLKMVLLKKLIQLILVMVGFLKNVNLHYPPVIWSVIFLLKIKDDLVTVAKEKDTKVF